jgi:hypothetical protein
MSGGGGGSIDTLTLVACALGLVAAVQQRRRRGLERGL